MKLDLFLFVLLNNRTAVNDAKRIDYIEIKRFYLCEYDRNEIQSYSHLLLAT